MYSFNRLQQFPMMENRTGPQTIEFLTKRILALGAVQSGHFLVDCETSMSIPQFGEFKLSILFIIPTGHVHFSDFPVSRIISIIINST